jgi:Protein of unknown function (DUF1800)/TAT (twin-arginine translocation) pathway signal sequence
MQLTRRHFLTLSGVATASALLASCSPARTLAGRAEGPGPWPVGGDPAWRALSRLTFGPRADERARAREIGLDAWIEEQLAPERIADVEARLRVRRFDTLTMDTSIVFGVKEENTRRELQQATLLRAVASQRQLYEIMVDFWSDHFSISALKGDCAWLKTIDDREVIRPHALGNFGDLLWASMRSPAMLIYLDNQENHAGRPNENYARELMELHTLGVTAGYTQRDVQEVARCLTGWTVDDQLYRGQFRFTPERHDDNAKTVLGQMIPPGGGARDAERVFDLLMAHPATPRFVAHKLVRRLVADESPAALVAAVAATFARTRGDIKAMLRTILHSAEFVAAPPKLKRPLHYVAGALRQLDAATDGGAALLDSLAAMGQPLFQWPTPDGFPDHIAAWDGALLARWRFALALARNEIPGAAIDVSSLVDASSARTPSAIFDRLGLLLLGAAPAPATRDQVLAALRTADGQDDATAMIAAIIASPAYQWR